MKKHLFVIPMFGKTIKSNERSPLAKIRGVIIFALSDWAMLVNGDQHFFRVPYIGRFNERGRRGVLAQYES